MMSNQILTILRRKHDDFAAGLDAETHRNALKEVLQLYVLNFIYHHPDYNKWTMYGGSALRIIHGLDRMSVDLDFEIPDAVTKKSLEELKTKIEDHFANTYGTQADFLTVKITTGRGLLLKFNLGDEFSFGHPSKQVHIKIDLNHFVAPKTARERRPINQDQLSFVIVTYNMSVLMASKIAAIFLRGPRGVGKATYAEKGRDIYDLLWYMNKKVVPDFDYLVAKGIDMQDPRALFDRLTLQMNKVNDKNLKQDIEPLFMDKIFIGNWLKNWRESYLWLLDAYKIRTIKELKGIYIGQALVADDLSFVYRYATKDSSSVRITYSISDIWIEFSDGDLTIKADTKLEDKIEFKDNGLGISKTRQEKLKQYATLFYLKTEKYFKKTNHIFLGDSINTKLIRMTADNFNPKEQIVLNKLAILSCEFTDLLK